MDLKLFLDVFNIIALTAAANYCLLNAGPPYMRLTDAYPHKAPELGQGGGSGCHCCPHFSVGEIEAHNFSYLSRGY